LGVAHEKTGLAAQVLASVGADPAALTEAVETAAPRRKAPTQGHLPFTAHAKRALELSYRESLDLDSDMTSTHHILLGILADDVNLAIQLLHEQFGITPPELRKAVLAALSGVAAAPANPAVGISDVLQRVNHLAGQLDRRLSRIETHLSLSTGEQ
jgi:ATP-dependent Clp protease ATP-binding subunit ClpC